MRWARRSNLIIIFILCLAYTITTFLNIIGPLHMNSNGTMNAVGGLAIYSLLYWLIALGMTWGLYFYLRRKPEHLFFTLLILGMALIIGENFLWSLYGP